MDMSLSCPDPSSKEASNRFSSFSANNNEVVVNTCSFTNKNFMNPKQAVMDLNKYYENYITPGQGYPFINTIKMIVKNHYLLDQGNCKNISDGEYLEIDNLKGSYSWSCLGSGKVDKKPYF